MSESISIRPARADDAAQLFVWRNDPHVRRMSINQEEISTSEHLLWVDRTLRRKDRLLLIGELIDGTLVGVVRFDLNLENDEAYVSIIIDPLMQGKGMSVLLLRAAINELVLKVEKVQRTVNIIAQIRHENAASLACFIKVGFTLYKQDELFKYMRISSPSPNSTESPV